MNAKALAVAATLADGSLAGSNIDRMVMQWPAYQRIGAEKWAEFSRHADLTWRAAALYPTESIGGVILSVATAVAVARSRRARKARIASVAAAAFAAGGLALTLKAAPNMLSLRHADADPQKAFDGFRFWSLFRGVCQVSAFVANVATLALL